MNWKQKLPFKPHLSGLLSWLPTKKTMQKRPARYFYSAWLRHLLHLKDHGYVHQGKVVAEIGPGSSLGMGLAALLTGASRFFAFDISRHSDRAYNLAVFDSLVDLFKNQTPIPGCDEFPNIRPDLEDLSFPEGLIKPEFLDSARVAKIRQAIVDLDRGDEGSLIAYRAPWDYEGAPRESVDLVFSQAVMEHVDDLDRSYGAMARSLKVGGYASHQIDFQSHGTALEWNGHWKYGPLSWKIIRGNRGYLINRQPFSVHHRLLLDNGFEILATHQHCNVTNKRYRGAIKRPQLHAQFQFLNDKDLKTVSALVICRKP